jgi:hypothetical protein
MSGHVIKYAIVSSDNTHYLDYWPVISKAWNKIGIHPILVQINGSKHDMIETAEETVYFLPQIDGIKTSFQAQIARLWIMTKLNGSCIISDIDMMPLNKAYFNQASEYPADTIVSYCSDAAKIFDGTYPMCYIVSDAAIFTECLTSKDWEEWTVEMANLYDQSWSTDQLILTSILNAYPKTFHLNRGWNESGIADNRIDRLSWYYSRKLLQKGEYYDAHLLRPYCQNESEIYMLLNYIK